jgi:hypothetical protein
VESRTVTESFETTNRLTALRGVQLVFGAGCVAVALPLIFRLGPAETVTNATSVRVLGAALLSFAVGAFSTVQDPFRHHMMFRVEIVFTALTAVFLIHRIVTDRIAHDPALALLPPVVICLALLLVLAPHSDAEPPIRD